MSWPNPVPGMVVRYSFLWSQDAAAGAEEGSKDRPCAIVVAAGDVATGIKVYLLPVTHTLPNQSRNAIEIPAAIKANLGLDADRSWIIIDEINSFDWPGYDLRPVPKIGSPVYGILPPAFFRHVRARFLDQPRLKITRRT